MYVKLASFETRLTSNAAFIAPVNITAARLNVHAAFPHFLINGVSIAIIKSNRILMKGTLYINGIIHPPFPAYS